MPLISLDMEHIDSIVCLETALFTRPFTAVSLASLFAGKAFAGYALRDDKDHRGDILSYILLHRVLDEAEILSLGTAHTHQGKGYAHRLLNETCQLLLEGGIHRLHLDVAAPNVAALALYKGCGFLESGRRPGYYGTAPHRQDAIIMSKTLR